MGMTIEEFARKRPNAKWYQIDWVGPLEPEKMKMGFLSVGEALGRGSEFKSAFFGFKDGHLVTIDARVWYRLAGLRDARRRAIQRAFKRWGEPDRKGVADDSARTGKQLALLVWEKEGMEIGLFLPRERLKDELGEAPMFLLMRLKGIPMGDRWKELDLAEPEKQALLRENDVP